MPNLQIILNDILYSRNNLLPEDMQYIPITSTHDVKTIEVESDAQ